MLRKLMLIVFGLICCANVAPSDLMAEKPNVIIIMVDDLGYGDLSSYGATDLQSPNIDALVKRGMRFDFAYANCPVCSPSRASLFTGQYPELVGVPGVIRTNHDNSWGYLSQDAVVLPTIMKTAGYHTALIGKWHLGLRPENHPNERGFDFFHGFLGDMMDDYYTHQRQGNDYMNRDRELIHPEGHATDLFTDWSCDYIKSRIGNQQPFCLSITYNAPHTPIQPPEEWFQKIKSRENGIEEKRAKLVALIEHLDAGVGKVIKTLEETGLDKNTLVIFTSDNGGQLNVGANNGGLRDGKQSMYEGGIRVPTCAVWPGKIAEGTKSNARILTMDILPTVCDAGEAKLEHKIDGLSFLSVLVGDTTTMPERDLFFHRREGGLRYGGLTTNALIRGRWKLLQNSPFAKQELYDLEADPVEANNLATKNRKKLNELTGALRAHVQRGGQVPWQKRD